jgi:hypothetical protein
MKKLSTLLTPGRIILALLIGLLVWFLLLPKVGKVEFIGAIIITLFSYEGFCLMFPESFFNRFKRKERNPLLEE